LSPPTAKPARSPQHWTIAHDGIETLAICEGPSNDGRRDAVFVVAHGAGGHMGDASMLAAAEAARAAGIHTVRFDFPYRAKGSRRPDAMPLLKSCIAAVAARARREFPDARLLLGGRSMGGRAASMLAAEGFACDGLVLLAYPLHPAGSPEKLRTAHLPGIEAPVLCVNGTRDALCDRALMTRFLASAEMRRQARWTMHWIEGADHSFKVLKSSGRTPDDVGEELQAAVRDWFDESIPGAAGNAGNASKGR
jgi:predicted alpha/beta-hydrolase family hydrolase